MRFLDTKQHTTDKTDVDYNHPDTRDRCIGASLSHNSQGVEVHKAAGRLGWPEGSQVLHKIRASNSASLFLEMGQVASAHDAILCSVDML